MPTNCSARKIRTVTRIPTGAPTTGYGGFETWQKQRGVEASVDELVEILQYLYIELKKKDGTDYESALLCIRLTQGFPGTAVPAFLSGCPLAFRNLRPSAGAAFIPIKHGWLLLGCTNSNTGTETPSASTCNVTWAVTFISWFWPFHLCQTNRCWLQLR